MSFLSSAITSTFVELVALGFANAFICHAAALVGEAGCKADTGPLVHQCKDFGLHIADKFIPAHRLGDPDDQLASLLAP